MWALILVIVGFIGFKYWESNEKNKLSNAYDVQISNFQQELESIFSIDEVNNIAQTSDNKDELIFNSGITSVIDNENFQFVEDEESEGMEFLIPSGEGMRRMFHKENRNMNNLLKTIQEDDLLVKKQIIEFVNTKGVKVFITKDRYSELKKVNITFAKGE